MVVVWLTVDPEEQLMKRMLGCSFRGSSQQQKINKKKIPEC